MKKWKLVVLSILTCVVCIESVHAENFEVKKYKESMDSTISFTTNKNNIDGGEQAVIQEESEPDYKVDTSTSIDNICSKPEFRKPARIVGVVVSFLKIIVPICIILFGVMDFYKAITSQKDDGIKKATKSIMIRAIAGVAIFLLPGLVQMVLNMVNEWSEYKNNWCCCTECILNSNCNVDSCSSESCHIEGTN